MIIYLKRGLGAVGKLREVNISFVMSVCLSVRPPVRPSVRIEQLGCLQMNFH